MSKRGWAVQYIPVALTGAGALSVYELSKYMNVESVSSWKDALTLLVNNPSYVYNGGILGVSLLCAPTFLPTGVVWLLHNTFLSRREIRSSFTFSPPLKFQEEWRSRIMSATELMRPIRAQNITTSVLSKIPTIPSSNEKKKRGYRVNGGDASVIVPEVEEPSVPNNIFAEDNLTWDLDDAIETTQAQHSEATLSESLKKSENDSIDLHKSNPSLETNDGPLDVEDDVFDTLDTSEIVAPSDARDLLKDAALKMQKNKDIPPHKPSALPEKSSIMSQSSDKTVDDEVDGFDDEEVIDAAPISPHVPPVVSPEIIAPTMLDDKAKEQAWSQPNWDFDGLEDTGETVSEDTVDGAINTSDDVEYLLEDTNAPVSVSTSVPSSSHKKNTSTNVPPVAESSRVVDKKEKVGLFSRLLSPLLGKSKEKEVLIDKAPVEASVSFEESLDHRILEWYTLWVQTPGNTANGHEKPEKLVEEGANIAALMDKAADQRLSDTHGLRGMMIKQALIAAKRAHKEAQGTLSQSTDYSNVVTKEEREEDIRGFDNVVDDEARVLIRPLSSDPDGPMDIEDDLDEEEEKLSYQGDTLYDGVVNEEVKNQDPDDLYRKLSNEDYTNTVSEKDVKISELLPKPIRSAEAEGKLHEMQRQQSDEWEHRLTLDDEEDKDDIIPFATSIAPEDNRGPVELDAETVEAYLDNDEAERPMPWSRKVLAPVSITAYDVEISTIYDFPIVLSPFHVVMGVLHDTLPFCVEITKDEHVGPLTFSVVRAPIEVVVDLDVPEYIAPVSEDFSVVAVNDDDVVLPMTLVHEVNPIRLSIEKLVDAPLSNYNNLLDEDEDEEENAITFVQASKVLIDNYIDNIFPAYRDWLDSVSFVNSVGQVDDIPLGSRQIIFRYEMPDGGRVRLQADIILGSWKGAPPLENGTMGLVVLLFIDVPAGNWKLLKNVDNLTLVPGNPFVDRWVLMNGDKVIPVRDALFENMAMGANDLGRRLSIVVQFMTHDGAQVTWEGPDQLDMGGLGHRIIWSKGAYFPEDHSNELKDMLRFIP